MASRPESVCIPPHVKHGAITLVLGAGVSIPRRVPSWFDLAADLWMGTFHNRPAWLTSSPQDGQMLKQVRKLLRGKVPNDFLARLTVSSAPPHPLALPIAFEEIEAGMSSARKDRLRKAPSPDDEVDDTFAGAIRDAMYRHETRRKGDSLSVIAEVMKWQQRSVSRRLVRVVTFNADDLLERELHRGLDEDDPPIGWVLARASHNLPNPQGDRLPPVPIYHVHGFLPKDPEERWWMDAPDTLVFTEAQYWQSTASPLSFANRVMAAALHDSHCVFIGVSMTDINIMRWLGVRYNEIDADRETQRRAAQGAIQTPTEKLKQQSLMRHVWVRTRSADETGLITSHLRRRGVESVVLPSWGAPFRAWMTGLFAEA